MSIAIYTYEENDHGDLDFSVAMGCGRKFDNVVTVVEPDSENPGLRINSPSATMGIEGLKDIIGMVEKRNADKKRRP